jgi:hypothetical protein
MFRSFLLRPTVARLIIALQVLPVIALRPRGYSVSSQEWWLPTLLAVLAMISAARVLIRGTGAPWPWYLFSFAQGFSIISKLMMFMPHASTIVDGVQRLDTTHVAVSISSMALSAFVIWYCEQPEVRNMFAPAASARTQSN